MLPVQEVSISILASGEWTVSLIPLLVFRGLEEMSLIGISH